MAVKKQRNMEIWKDVIGFESNYSVSSLGRVKRKASLFVRSDGVVRSFRERLLGGNLNKKYHFVALQGGSVSKKYPVHRLVAAAFIPNPDNKPEVNHKNGVRSDNRVANLEWCTKSENAVHSIEVLGNHHGGCPMKRVMDVSTKIEYESIAEAAKMLGVPTSSVKNILHGRVKKTKGHILKYV